MYIFFLSQLFIWWPSFNIALVFLSVFNRASSSLQFKKLYLWQAQLPCTVQCDSLILCGSNPVAKLPKFLTAPSSLELFGRQDLFNPRTKEYLGDFFIDFLLCTNPDLKPSLSRRNLMIKLHLALPKKLF